MPCEVLLCPQSRQPSLLGIRTVPEPSLRRLANPTFNTSMHKSAPDRVAVRRRRNSNTVRRSKPVALSASGTAFGALDFSAYWRSVRDGLKVAPQAGQRAVLACDPKLARCTRNPAASATTSAPPFRRPAPCPPRSHSASKPAATPVTLPQIAALFRICAQICAWSCERSAMAVLTVSPEPWRPPPRPVKSPPPSAFGGLWYSGSASGFR